MAEGDSEDDSSRTEDPTPKRLEEARRKGQVALSREFNSWLLLLAATLLIAMMASPMMAQTTELLKVYIEQAATMPGVPGGFKFILGGAAMAMAKILALPVFFLMVAAFFGPFVQVGAVFAPDVVRPDLGKVSIVKGFSRLFSMRSLLDFAKGLLKLAMVTIVGVILLKPYMPGLSHIVGLPIGMMLDEMKSMVVRMMAGILIVYMAIAIIDVVYQRVEFMRRMRMSKQEVKEEYRQTEGDPQVKAKLKQIRSQKARQRMMSNVPKADVVITNPTHFAIALQYDPDTMDAPVCLAKGMDSIALKIREVARENNVTIYENKPLARALYDTVEIDEAIPPEHYKAVAQIISFVFKQKGRI